MIKPEFHHDGSFTAYNPNTCEILKDYVERLKSTGLSEEVVWNFFKFFWDESAYMARAEESFYSSEDA
jgi:hypothetical protein